MDVGVDREEEEFLKDSFIHDNKFHLLLFARHLCAH